MMSVNLTSAVLTTTCKTYNRDRNRPRAYQYKIGTKMFLAPPELSYEGIHTRPNNYSFEQFGKLFLNAHFFLKPSHRGTR